MSEPSPSPHSPDYPRAALVTGAARRIGLAIARDLAADGWAVALHYRNAERDAEAAVAEIARAGGRAVALRADLAEERDSAALLERATEALGPIGCLVNNASEFELDLAESVTRESWDRHLEPNLRAPFVLCQDFVRLLPPERCGAVINLLDQRVLNLTPYFVSYTVSKSALWTLTRTLAMALAPRVRVNAIGPGPCLPSPRQSRAQFDRQCATMPLRRGTSPEEIAAAVRFLLAMPAMTGQLIALDGGQHLGWAQPAREGFPEEE